jgi:hypothetical protein
MNIDPSQVSGASGSTFRSRTREQWRTKSRLGGKRPKADERRLALLSEASIIAGVCGTVEGGKPHECKENRWPDPSGIMRSCVFQLYSTDFNEAIDRLRTQRQLVLKLPQRERGRLAFEAMHLERSPASPGTENVVLMANGRNVCKCAFDSHFCISTSVRKMLTVGLLHSNTTRSPNPTVTPKP